MQPGKLIFSKLHRLLLLALLLGAAGCQTHMATGRRPGPVYYKVTTLDYRGGVVAEWIAEGNVRHVEDGYCFIAVERRVFHPDIVSRYPSGKPTLVTSANVDIVRTDQPEWLKPAAQESAPVQN